jgi:hypothetical protein
LSTFAFEATEASDLLVHLSSARPNLARPIPSVMRRTQKM